MYNTGSPRNGTEAGGNASHEAERMSFFFK
jgi:hypothetical protein